jgi:hypothetical protein
MSNRKSQQLLEEYHQWLSGHEVDTTGEPEARPWYVAVGIYYTDRPEQGEDSP